MKCSASLAFYLFSPTRLINSIKHEHSCKVLFVTSFFQGKLNTYRFCDNVWTFVLNNVEFQEMQEIAKVDKVKIVACDGKGIN